MSILTRPLRFPRPPLKWRLSTGLCAVLVTSLVFSLVVQHERATLRVSSLTNQAVHWRLETEERDRRIEEQADRISRLLERAQQAEERGIRSVLEVRPGLRGIAYSPDGRTLAAPASQRVVFWDTATGRRYETEPLHRNAVFRLVFTPDGRSVFSGGMMDGVLREWDASDGTNQSEWRAHPDEVDGVLALALSPDGHTLLSSGGFTPRNRPLEEDDTRAKLWDLSGNPGPPLLVGLLGQPDQTPIYVAAFSVDGAMVATGGRDGRITVWDVATRSPMRVLTGHRNGVTGIIFEPESGMLLSCGFDSTVKRWSLSTEEPSPVVLDCQAFRPSGIRNIALHPNGWLVAAVGWRQVKLWDTRSGTDCGSLSYRDEQLESVAFDPDGTTLAVACSRGKVVLWHLGQLPIR